MPSQFRYHEIYRARTNLQEITQTAPDTSNRNGKTKHSPRVRLSNPRSARGTWDAHQTHREASPVRLRRQLAASSHRRPGRGPERAVRGCHRGLRDGYLEYSFMYW